MDCWQRCAACRCRRFNNQSAPLDLTITGWIKWRSAGDAESSTTRLQELNEPHDEVGDWRWNDHVQQKLHFWKLLGLYLKKHFYSMVSAVMKYFLNTLLLYINNKIPLFLKYKKTLKETLCTFMSILIINVLKCAIFKCRYTVY